MSYAETTTQTAFRFIPSWQNQDLRRTAIELLSVSKETHRQKDSYHFEVTDGQLMDPETGKPIKNFVERQSYLGNIEYTILEQLEKWAQLSEEGASYWISAPYKDIYPCSKVIIHQIAYTLTGEKVVLNTAITFDAHIANPEELRRRLFVEENPETAVSEVLNWIEEVTGQAINLGDIGASYQEAEYFAQKIAAGYSHRAIVDEMQSSGFLGQKPISCPPSLGMQPTFSNFLLRHSTVVSTEGKFIEKCGSCGTEIKAVIHKGYKCQECGGIYEGC